MEEGYRAKQQKTNIFFSEFLLFSDLLGPDLKKENYGSDFNF